MLTEKIEAALADIAKREQQILADANALKGAKEALLMVIRTMAEDAQAAEAARVVAAKAEVAVQAEELSKLEE